MKSNYMTVGFKISGARLPACLPGSGREVYGVGWEGNNSYLGLNSRDTRLAIRVVPLV